MKLYVKTLDGEACSVDVESPEDIQGLRNAVQAQGIKIDDDAPLITSFSEFEPDTSAEEMEAFAPADNLPPIPKPTDVNDMPPQTSEKILVATNPNEQLKFDIFGEYLPFPSASTPGFSVDPPLPPFTLQYNRYWQSVGYRKISGEQSYVYSATTTEGMSDTDSQTLSAEMGVAQDGLSEKLTQTFSTSVTVSSSTSVTNSYTIDVDAGKIGVWILWQLVDEVIAIDNSGNQLEYSGFLVFPDGKRAAISLPVTQAAQESSSYTGDITTFDQETSSN